MMKLIAAINRFDPERLTVSIGGNMDSYCIKVVEYSESTGEGSQTIEHQSTIYFGQGDDLLKLEREAVKVIRGLKP